MCFNTWLMFNAVAGSEHRALYKSQLLSVEHCLSHTDTKQIDVTVGIPGIRSL